MMTPERDIDRLLRDLALLVVQLRKGERVDQGKMLWTRSRDALLDLQHKLRDANYDDTTIDHITYALAALLDETVLNRPQDEGSLAWLDNPLQTYFFNTFDAGNRLYDHIQRVLQEATPVPLVLSCFHRVLMLGFHGRYPSGSAERDTLISTLATRIAPWSGDQPLTKERKPYTGIWHRLKDSRLWWAGLTLCVLLICWYGLHSSLQHLLTQLIPGH
ncbi:type VI secretion system protein TssL, short form [Enterobacteriaceae bacterium LUAb1]